METVASGDDIAGEFELLRAVPKADPWSFGFKVMQRQVADAEAKFCGSGQSCRDEILDHLLLTVHRDRTAAGEFRKIYAVPDTAEAQLDAAMHQAFAPHAIANTRLIEQVDAALLEHAGTHPLLDVFATARLEDDRLDAFQMEKMHEQQSGGPGPDDTHLRAQF